MGWFSRGVIYNVAFSTLGDHVVSLKVRDGVSTSEVKTAIIHVVDEAPGAGVDLGLVSASLTRDGDSLLVDWFDEPAEARYVYVRYGGYPLGMAEVANDTLLIEHNDFAEEFTISLAYLDENHEMGEFADFVVADLADGETLGEIEPVDTGLCWRNIWEAFGLLLALAVALWCYVFG